MVENSKTTLIITLRICNAKTTNSIRKSQQNGIPEKMNQT